MQEALLPRVQSAFQHAFNLDDPRSITLDTQRADIPRWDSYGHATLALSLEREFDIELDVDDLTAMETVLEIIRVVGLKLGPAT